MKLNDLELKYFKDLTQIDGVSGHEKEVARYLINEFNKLGLEVVKDNFGNVFGVKKSKAKNPFKVLVDGHMDEVGFIVKKIKENGTIVPFALGGFNANTLLSTRVKLHSNSGKIYYGSIDSTPPHLLKGEEQKVNLDNLIFDFGFKSKEEVLNEGILPGDMISLVGEFHLSSNEERILSKAIDDRYGLVLGLDILNELKDVELPFDLYVSGSTQEEVGCRGINAAFHNMNFDLAIICDCSTAKDTISSDESGRIGDGLLLRFVDRTMIANPALIALQKEACEKTNSKYQYFDTLGGTNAGITNLNNCLTLTHCICGRSIHTASTFIDVNDFIYAKNSLIYLLKNLNEEKLNEVKELRY